MALEPFSSLVSEQAAAPAAVALGAGRALGITIIFPLFTLFNVTGILRFGLAIGLSAPSVVHAYSVLSGGQTPWLEVAGLSLKEIAFGALLGMGFGIPFWAAQAAGDMTDVYRGANAANLFDQVNSLETTPLGSLLMSIALGIFVAAGGIVDLVAIFYNSFALWPLFTLAPTTANDWLAVVLESFARLFRVGALLASPFIVVMCAVELSLAFVGRSARQFPMNDGAATFKNLAVVLVLAVYATFATSYFGSVWTEAFSDMKGFMETGLGKE
ncbi:flagellar biosynthetic protein FliR [Rhizobium sp. TRM95111]|uniref:EscT/YscT/HrcT family type III secretion system export apparatus protein n=1 Tax=Rhizobium alarense TaxID=2846851 RepID=UPI001F167033|nr:flagellar biosynthetic protein FliR [Rhizobium alarense]MCF3641592.1 flagellar biosynthetic protein FliR [Rhizobium alarense]